MIISHSKKFIHVHIHKTGGTSVAVALEPQLEGNDIICGSTKRGEIQEKAEKATTGLDKHSYASAIRPVVGEDAWNRYFTFGFVRNPYARIASLYTWLGKVANPSGVKWKLRHLMPNHEPWCWPGMKAYTSAKDFSEFIRHEEFVNNAPAAKPMADWLTEDGKLIVDFVGKLENMQDDFSTVATAIGCEGLSLSKKNVSVNKPGREDFYRKQDDRDYIYEKYRCDFDLFEYARR